MCISSITSDPTSVASLEKLPAVNSSQANIRSAHSNEGLGDNIQHPQMNKLKSYDSAEFSQIVQLPQTFAVCCTPGVGSCHSDGSFSEGAEEA